MSWAAIVFTFALVDNVVLSRLLGLPSADRHAVEEKGLPRPPAGAALRLGAAMAVLMSVSAVAAWVVDSLVLIPLGLSVLRTPVMVFLVAGIALGFQALGRRLLPSALEWTGVSLPRVGVNCVVLGLVLVTTRSELGPLASFLAGLAAGVGYVVATVLMEAVAERLEIEQVPAALRGLPLQLITAGLMAYAFMAFDRAFLARLLGA